MDWLTDLGWSSLASIAGVIGFLLALYTFLGDRLAADVRPRWEVHEQNGQDVWRIAVENRGGHTATDLHVTAMWEGEPTRVGLRPGPTLTELHPGQTFRFGVSRRLATRFDGVELRWRDGRRWREQRRTVALSQERVR